MKLSMKLKTLFAGLTIGMMSASAIAGPYILAGTDADDHGFFSAGANQDGWFFMQRALENIASGVTNSNHTVAVLGSTSTAAAAAHSAFDNSSIAGPWNRVDISVAGLAAFFNGTATTNINNVGILMMDSDGNVAGGVSGTNFTPYATGIDTFLLGGGGLFSQANGYQWLSALIPGASAPGESNTGISLTPAGNASFPGLNNGDLSAGPYHQYFTGFGGIQVLGTSNATGHAIIIGGATGSITQPAPEPGSILLLGLGLLGLLAVYRRKQG